MPQKTSSPIRQAHPPLALIHSPLRHADARFPHLPRYCHHQLPRTRSLFEPAGERNEDQERLIAQLHQKIGELTVDLDWLKKKSKQLGL